MGARGHDGFAIPGRIILARELAFAIGPLQVDPPHRQVRLGGERQTLEPRVMQVLVALARANGEIVTRDELAEACWDGRIVGNDSINRVLSRIRRVAGEIGGGSFVIETISKVGYRLKPGQAEEWAFRTVSERRGAPFVNRRTLVAGVAAITFVGVAGGAALWAGAKGREEPRPEAKALYDRALAIRQDGASNNRQALAYLREAVRLSPEYGEAWGALALAYRSAIDNEAPERVSGFEERLREAVRNAEHFDPGNADAAVALLPSGSFFGRWPAFERLYRSAIQRHPNHVAGYSLLGTLLMDVGRWTDAAAMLRAANAHDPSSPVLRYKLVVSLWASGRISAADNEIDRAMQLWPEHGAIWQTKIKLLALTGRPREALALASDPAAMPLDAQDAPNQQARLLFLTALATRSPGDADRAIDAMLRQARAVELDRPSMALQATALGRIELALDMLEGVFVGSGEWALRSAGRDSSATHALFQPHARPLWREPRFKRIVDRIGLEDYWRETATLPDYRRRT